MKFTKNILMVLSLLLQVGVSFTASSNEAQRILNRVRKEKSSRESYHWEPSGPTGADIRAATKVENLAAKGGLDDQLISAVKNGDLKNVEALISAGAGLEARDDKAMTVLMIAARKGYPDIASRLINLGAHVDAKTIHNRTALFYAEEGGHTKIAKLLIANSADKKLKEPGRNLFGAAVRGDTEKVKALLVEGARISDDDLDAACWIARKAEIKSAIKEFQKKSNS